ncbi:MAG: uroporphyrinogen-III C-methyltransferase [Pseudomonadota bacterium]
MAKANQEIVEHSTTPSSDDAPIPQPAVKTSSAGMLAFVFIAVLISLLAGAFSFFLFQQLEQQKTKLGELKLEIGGQLSGKLDGVSGKFSSVSDRFTSVSDRISRFNDNISKINTEVQQLDGLLKQELKQQTGLFKQYVLQQQDVVKSQQSSIKKLETTIKKSQLTQQISIEQLSGSINKLYKQKGRTRNDWILSEVEYLLLIGNHGLNLSFDVNTAIIALESADARLLDMADPGTIAIRKSIAEELIQLKAVPVIDVAGMQATLSAMIKHSVSLPVLNSEIPGVDDLLGTVKTVEPIVADKKPAENPLGALQQFKNELKKGADKFLNELKNLVVYRNKKIAATALIAPEQKFFLQQHISLKLESARKALLDGKDDLFQSLLAETQELLIKFFDSKTRAVTSFTQQLKSLQSQKLLRQLPDISKSLDELKKYVAKLEQRRLAAADDVAVQANSNAENN